MLPWQQKFGIKTIWSLSNDDGDGNENGKKAISLGSKESAFFVHFLADVALRRREKVPNFTRPFYKLGDTTHIFFFLSLKLNTVLSGLTQENLANIRQIN